MNRGHDGEMTISQTDTESNGFTRRRHSSRVPKGDGSDNFRRKLAKQWYAKNKRKKSGTNRKCKLGSGIKEMCLLWSKWSTARRRRPDVQLPALYSDQIRRSSHSIYTSQAQDNLKRDATILGREITEHLLLRCKIRGGLLFLPHLTASIWTISASN